MAKWRKVPANTIIWMFQKSCKTCIHLHLKLKWSCEDLNKPDFWCQNTPNFEKPHWGIVELPKELYCNKWEASDYYSGE